MEARTLSILGQAAIVLARLGFAVFPLKDRSKIPFAGSNGCKDATSDEAQIGEWWTRFPDANIGIATGGGLVVVDIDSPEAMAACSGRGLPATVVAATGRGWHYYYRGDGRSLVGVLPGVDTRGDGGYVVAPPSIHESGRTYAWEDSPEHTALADAPPWLADLSRALPRAEGGTAALPRDIIAGGRNAALASLAGTVRAREASEAAIFALLRVTNDERCRPPLDEKEVQKIARSFASYEPSSPLPTTGVEPGAYQGIELWTAADMAGDPPPTDYIASRLHLAAGRPMALTGYAGAGKTLLLADLLLACASSEHPSLDGRTPFAWGSVPVERGGVVVHLDLELGRKGTWNRYKRLARGRGFDVAELGDRLRWRSYPAFRLNQPDALDVLCRTLEGVTLCGLDSLRALLPGVRENDSEIADQIGILGAVSDRTGCAFVLLHHEGKPGEDGQRAAAFRGRGSSAIQGCLSSQWSVSPKSAFWLLEHGKSEHDEAGKPIKVALVASEERGADGKSRSLRFAEGAEPVSSVAEVQAAYAAMVEVLYEAVAGWGEQGCAGLGAVASHLHRGKDELRPAWHELTSGDCSRLYNVTGKGGAFARWKVRQ